MFPTIIDIHTHAQMKAYAHSFQENGTMLANSRNYQDKNSTWWSDWPSGETLRKQVESLFGLTCFTQSDFRTCFDGGVHLTFSSLYPIEKGFLSPFNKDLDCFDRLIDKITGFGKGRIDYVQGIDDYFHDLVREDAFQRAHDGEIFDIIGQKFRYKYVNNFDELKQLYQNQPDGVKTMGVINTIEGAHSFGTGIAPFRLRKDFDRVIENIKSVKKDWEYPPFFLTLAHHFYNEICGHAKSLGLSGVALDQSAGLDSGFTKEGKQIVHHLLDHSDSRRIIIDTKHMSYASRKEYYELLASDYPGQIPILFSHGGVTGCYDKGIRSRANRSAAQKFREDDINLFDFEIPIICESGGLIGIQFDERRIARARVLKRLDRADTRSWPSLAAGLIWEQVLHIALVLDQQGHFAWGVQCIGSDFDGIVDPVNGIFSSAYFKSLRQLLLEHVIAFKEKEEQDPQITQSQNKIAAETIVDRFLYQNVWSFLEQHFH